MKRTIVFMVACLALWHSGNALAGNFAECILDKMPGTANAPAASAVYRSCTAEYWDQYRGVEKGSGLGFFGLFGFKTPEECLIKKSRDTVQQNAAFMIAAACRCLYEKPSFSGEKCAYLPVSYQAPVVAPTVVTPPERPAPPPVITQPPPQFTAPSLAETKEAALKRAYEEKSLEDLNVAAYKAIYDYPYLNTPAGKTVLESIVSRRDELIRQGIYPSIAMNMAVAGIAPLHVPAPPIEKPAEPIPVYPAIDKGNHVGFPTSCRWVTPSEWSCK